MPPLGASPPPSRPPPPGALRGVGAENPPLFPPPAELRDKSCSVSRSGLLEFFGRTRFGLVSGASGVSSFGAEFGGVSVFGAGAVGGGGWLALGCTPGALGNSLAVFGCGTGCGA